MTGNRQPDLGRSEISKGGTMKMRPKEQIERGALRGVERESRESTVEGPPNERQSEQYSLAEILGISRGVSQGA